MQNENINISISSIKKLRKKAELCRYCHSSLHRNNQLFLRVKEFSILLLSLLLPLLINLYYREILDERVLISALVIPSMILFIQGLDNILFHWTDKVAEHQASVHIWGEFVREADFVEKNYKDDEDEINKKMLHKKYSNCMNNSIMIPNRNFLKCKKGFRKHVLKSKEIDTMTLEDMDKN